MNRERVLEEMERIRADCEPGGYRLHPDAAFVEQLVAGILVNRDRHGYDSCPCRLATGDRERDLPIVCPCVYRDEDLAQYNACFCALYVTADFSGDDNPVVPERWQPWLAPAGETAGPAAAPGPAGAESGPAGGPASGPFAAIAAQVCTVCGYVALMKDRPPRKCPVCGVGPERFVRIELAVLRSG